MTAALALPTQPTLEQLQDCFLAIVPIIRRHRRVYFRLVTSDEKKEDLIEEMVALAWNWFVRMAQKGKDATQFPSTLATFAARAVRSGHRLTGQVRARDVLSPIAQQRHQFTVSKLPDISMLSTNPLEEALIDNTRSPVPDQVQFRIDWPDWLRTRTQRDRRIIHDMAVGERTMHLARRFGISPARVSQLRRQYRDDWRQFTGEAEPCANGHQPTYKTAG